MHTNESRWQPIQPISRWINADTTSRSTLTKLRLESHAVNCKVIGPGNFIMIPSSAKMEFG